MIIRPATAADIGPIAIFQTECWREAYRGLVPQDYLDRVTVADRELRWRVRLLSGERQIALAVAGEPIAGVVSWADTTPLGDVPPLELKSLYVAAAHRGGGLALALAEYALQGRAAQLWVFDGNHRAEAFYAKLGFSPDGGSMEDLDTGLTEHRWVRH
jgi:GNAT superfamily N-acetyltransferase